MERRERASIFRDESYERLGRRVGRREASGLRADCRGDPSPPPPRPRPALPVRSPARPGLLVAVLPGEFPPLHLPKPRSPLSLDPQNKKPVVVPAASTAAHGRGHLGRGVEPSEPGPGLRPGVGEQGSSSVGEAAWRRGWELCCRAGSMHK